jgi:hypothetical protein
MPTVLWPDCVRTVDVRIHERQCMTQAIASQLLQDHWLENRAWAQAVGACIRPGHDPHRNIAIGDLDIREISVGVQGLDDRGESDLNLVGCWAFHIHQSRRVIQ